MGLISAFRVATWGAQTFLGAVKDFVLHPIDSVAGATDVRRLLRTFEKIPGIEEKNVDAEYLNKSLVIFQMGRLSFCMTHDEYERTNTDIVHIDPAAMEKTLNAVGRENFNISVVSHSDKTREPDISMIINTVNFSKSPDKITADALVEAMTIPVKRVPVVGGLCASMLGWPVRKIADFMFGTIFEQSKSLINMLPAGKKTEAEKPPTPPQPPSSAESREPA